MKLLPFIGALLLSTAPVQACEELDEVCITSDVALTTSPQSAIAAVCFSPISGIASGLILYALCRPLYGV